jgi:hypothetical protein
VTRIPSRGVYTGHAIEAKRRSSTRRQTFSMASVGSTKMHDWSLYFMRSQYSSIAEGVLTFDVDNRFATRPSGAEMLSFLLSAG